MSDASDYTTDSGEDFAPSVDEVDPGFEFSGAGSGDVEGDLSSIADPYGLGDVDFIDSDADGVVDKLEADLDGDGIANIVVQMAEPEDVLGWGEALPEVDTGLVAEPADAFTYSSGYAWLDDLNSQVLTQGQWTDDFAAANGFDHWGTPSWETALQIGQRNAELWDPYNSIPGGSEIVSGTVDWAQSINGGTLPPSSGVFGPEIMHANTGLDGEAAPGWNIYDYYFDNQA